jgi:hypothetical protein
MHKVVNHGIELAIIQETNFDFFLENGYDSSIDMMEYSPYVFFPSKTYWTLVSVN